MSIPSLWKFVTGILLKPQAADPSTTDEGSLWYNSTEDRLKGYSESAVREFVTTDQAQTLSNKTVTDPVITIADNDLTIQDNSDPTKQLQLQLSGITTGNTRTLTIPDGDSTILTTDLSQGISNKTMNSTNAISLYDSNFTLSDQADNSKIFQFEADSITTGNIRTLTIPDANTTLVGHNATQTLTNKTIDGDNNTLSDIGISSLKTVLADANKAVQRDAAGIVVSGASIPSTSSVLVDTTASQTLTNKAIDGDTNTISDVGITSLKTELADANKAIQRDAAGIVVSGASIPSTSSVLVDTTAAQALSNKTIDGDTNTVQDLALTSLKTVLADANKAIKRDASGIVVSGPAIAAAATTLVDTSTVQTIGAKTLDNTNTIAIRDAEFQIQDNSVTSVKLLFDANGTAATTTTIKGNQTVNRVVTLPDATDTLVGKDTTDVLTNKTLSGNTASTLINGSGTLALNSTGTITVPNATDTLVGKDTTDTLTNKTLTSPTINTPTTDVVTFDDQATPANPAAGFFKLYFKSDGELYKLNSAGVETVFSTGAVGANTQLSNLGVTSINADLLPSAEATRALGSASLAWLQMHANNFTVVDSSTNTRTGRTTRNDAPTPSGVTITGIALQGDTGTDNVGAFSTQSAAVDATATGALYLETGNKVGGTGNSGLINIQTGTSVGGTRGVINLNGSAVNTTDTQFKINDASDPTKKILFDAGGTASTTTTITAAQTANRVVTLPDATTTLAGLAVAQTFSAAQTFSSTIGIADGSVGAPSLAFSSDGANTGIYRVAADSLGFAANGVNAGQYESTTAWTLGGSAGLGTGAAAYHKFYGSLVGLSTNPRFTAPDNAAIGAGIYRDGANVNKAFATVTGYVVAVTDRPSTALGNAFRVITNYQDAQAADTLLTTTNQIVVQTVTGAGNHTLGPTIGLGTAAGAYHTIHGSIVNRYLSSSNNGKVSSQDAMAFGTNHYHDGAGAAKALSSSSGYTVVVTDRVSTAGGTTFRVLTNTAAQTIDTALTVSGQVTTIQGTAEGTWNIGPTSFGGTHVANGNLNVVGAAGNSSAFTILVGNTTDFSLLNFGDTGSSTAGRIVYDHSTDLMSFRTAASATDKFTISSDGACTIGAVAEATHTIQSSSISIPTSIVRNHSTSSSSDARPLFSFVKGSTTNTAGTNRFIEFNINAGGTASGYLASNGANSAAFFNTSDRRAKKDIIPLEGALNKILQLNPVNYRWKADNSEAIGFIAQELAEVLPQQVGKSDDGFGDDLAEGQTPWSMTESGFTPYLVKAMQELSAKLDTLQSEFDTYKSTHP